MLTGNFVWIANSVESYFLELVTYIVLLKCYQRPHRARAFTVFYRNRRPDVAVQNDPRKLIPPYHPVGIDDHHPQNLTLDSVLVGLRILENVDHFRFKPLVRKY